MYTTKAQNPACVSLLASQRIKWKQVLQTSDIKKMPCFRKKGARGGKSDTEFEGKKKKVILSYIFFSPL